MKKIFLTLALLCFLVGLLMITIGYAYRAPNAVLERGLPKIAPLEAIAMEMRRLPYKTRQQLQISTDGLLIPFGGGGGGLGVLGVILLALSMRKVREKPVKKKKAAKPQAEKTTAAPQPAVPGATTPADVANRKIAIDESLITQEIEDDDLWDDINNIISLSHSSLDQEQAAAVLKKLNPALFAYKDLLSEEVVAAFAKQALNIYIVRTKRSEEGITPDQFRIQDTRMNELIRETVARRFVPKDLKSLAPAARAFVGKVYRLSDQAQVQQSTKTQAEDWVDMSSRNAAEVIKEEIVTA